MENSSFVYDLRRLLWLHEIEQRLDQQSDPALALLTPPSDTPRRLAVLCGSFNPLTLGHVALVDAARQIGADAALLLLPLRAVDKEAITRAAPVDRALTLLEWTATQHAVGVALANRGLYVEQAALLAARYPGAEIVFVVGHDKIVQVFDPRYYTERDRALAALFERAAFAVAPRQGHSETELHELLTSGENRPYATRVAPLTLAAGVDTLSSSVVRDAARMSQPYEHLVPAATAELLRETLPYSPPHTLPGGEEIDIYGLRLALLGAAASGRLASDADFAALCQESRAPTPEGKRLRAWLAANKWIP